MKTANQVVKETFDGIIEQLEAMEEELFDRAMSKKISWSKATYKLAGYAASIKYGLMANMKFNKSVDRLLASLNKAAKTEKKFQKTGIEE
ncbi:MAG: hypothetical protein KKE01_07970 [Candidatus Omnitrophica bacterium]|nr:hypothetical protein [Candidatus Omnitrophota bacterium]